MLPLAQPPRKDDNRFDDWMYRLWRKLITAGQIAWNVVDKSGSNLTDIETRNHNDLQSIQGGTTNDYSHLTAAQNTGLTGGVVTALHKHDFDYVAFPTAYTIGTMPHLYTLSELMDHEWSAGVVDGCDITDNLDGTVSISSAVSTIRADTNAHSTLYGVATPAQLNIALTDNATNYLYLNYAGVSTAFAVTTTETVINGLNKVLAWEIHRSGNSIHYIDQRSQTVDAIRKSNYLRSVISRFSHDSGGTALGASGLTLNVTAGAFHRRLENLPHTAFDTSIAGTANENVFTLWNRVTGVYTATANSKVIDTTLWDNGTNAVTLDNNKFGVSWVYIANNSPSELHVVMGHAQYLKLSDAAVASPPSTIPTLLSGFGSLIGFVAYEKSNTSFNGIYSAFTQAFSPSLATQHNGLGGLQGGTLNEYYHLNSAQYGLLPSGTPTAGQVPTATSPTTVIWATPSSGSAVTSNVISTPTTIATDTSYIVASYLKIDSDLVINGNLMITG